MSTVTREHDGGQAGIPWQIALWAAQILLFIAYGVSGVMNSFASADGLMTMGMTHAAVLPYWLLRFLGISELAGVLGIILPALTRIKPVLTPLAALGFTTIQVLAIGFHMARGELAQMAPINLTLLGLSLFVLWGRLRIAPIAPRS
jgi:hypothetical protein